MNKPRSAFTAVLICFLLALALSACGTSGSTAGTQSTASSNIQMSVAAGNQLVTVSWTDPTYPAGSNETYNVYYSNSPIGANPMNDVGKTVSLIASNTTSPFNHTGLTNGKPYYYFVTRASGSAAGTPSLAAMAVPQTATPAAPDGLSISATDSKITLAFDTTTASQPSKAGQTCTYNIYYNTSGTQPISQNYSNKIANATFDPVTHTSIPIPDLSDGITYYFAVTVVVNGVESNESDTLSATPNAAAAATSTTPGAPDNLSVEPGNQQAIISWSSTGSGTVYYTIQAAKNDPTFATNTTTVSNITGTSYTLTGLTNVVAPNTYYFRVSASLQSTNATPVYSTVISATPYTKVPDVPSGIAASQGSQQVALSWSQDTSGIQSTVSYNIYYYPVLSSSTSQLPFTDNNSLKAAAITNNYVITDITTNSYVHTGLTPNYTYYYVITSVGEGESAPSSIVAVSL